MNDGKDHANVVESRYVEKGEGLEEPARANHHQQLAVQVKIDLKAQRVGLIKPTGAHHHQQLAVQVKIDLHTHTQSRVNTASRSPPPSATYCTGQNWPTYTQRRVNKIKG